MKSLLKGESHVFCDNYSSSSFLNDVNGHLLALGDNNEGKLGIGNGINQKSPAGVLDLDNESVQMVSSGEKHTIILSKGRSGHKVYSCGGIELERFEVESFESERKGVPLLLPFFSEKGKDVIQVAAGRWSSYCLLSNGALYSFGRNAYGQLGIGNRFNAITPQRVKIPGKMKIESISAGALHLAALGSDKQVYTFGWNFFGQLGRDGSVEVPARVEGLDGMRVKDTMCGSSSTFVVVKRNEIYSFGFNGLGNLGIGSTSNQCRPQRVSFFDTHPARILSVGGRHAIAILENGDLYSFGFNGHGQLLIGDQINRMTPTKVENTLGDGRKIIDVKCGSKHTLFVTVGGNCYGVGNCVAFSESKDVISPMMVLKKVFINPPVLPVAPSPTMSVMQSILQFFLEENRGSTKTGVANFFISVKCPFGEISELLLDKDFLRLRCPDFDSTGGNPSKSAVTKVTVTLETFLSEKMKETILYYIFLGKNEILQSLQMTEKIGLHRFLTLCPLSEKLKVKCERDIRREVDSSIQMAVHVITEAEKMNAEGLAEYAKTILVENFEQAVVLFKERDSFLFEMLIEFENPEKTPLPSLDEIRETNLDEIILMLHEEASSDISGDIVITCDNEDWRAHKFVLIARSPYFRRLILGERTNTATMVLPLKLRSSFPSYLRFMYTGEVFRGLDGEPPVLPSVEFLKIH